MRLDERRQRGELSVEVGGFLGFLCLIFEMCLELFFFFFAYVIIYDLFLRAQETRYCGRLPLISIQVRTFFNEKYCHQSKGLGKLRN